ncbi:MAG: hypothetical protein QF751_07050 [Alphaproteobacteria bacterium]|nr:hypothetical protein [Alphaproteobacteria bacterium]MDP6781768.1 hypothetical protein [Alphaproteobacteria bacterium]
MTTPQVRSPVPFDVAAIEAAPDWRYNLAWPLAHEERCDVLKAQMRALIDFVCAAPHEVRDILSLAAQVLTHNAKVLADTALTLNYAERRGLHFSGDRPELAFLRGDITSPEQSARSWNPPLVGAGPRWARRIARTASWTPWWRLPGACLFPSAMAASHNSLLRAGAAVSSKSVGFRHADSWLEAARAAAGDVPPTPGLDELAASLADALAAVKGLEELLRGRLQTLIGHHARQAFATADRDLVALRGFAGLPGELWAGTGGSYPVRALSLEVLRRGGKVVHFDHGGPNGFIEDFEGMTVSELMVASEFVLTTPEVAGMFSRVGAVELIDSLRRVTVSGGPGDPVFQGSGGFRRRPYGARPRVVYVPTTLVGFRQLHPPVIPDVVSLDWQMRVAEALSEMPVELSCRVHPEGLHPGDHHPLADIAPLAGGSFDDVIAGADVLVIDCSVTTTFWQCLCSDVPVVYLHMDVGRLTAEAWPIIERRCRVIRTTYDERDLPQFDREQLADAVGGGCSVADPAELRRLLAGVNAP